MKKIGSGVILMFYVILIAAILPASLWYASPWSSWRPNQQMRKSVTGKKPMPSFALSVNKVAAQYYGKLGQQGGVATRSAGIPEMAVSAVAPAQGRVAGMGGGVADAKMISGTMPAFEFKNYKFEYKGELAVGSSSVEVLRRLKAIDTGMDVSGLLAGLNFGPADLSTFSGMALQNANFIQKGEYGYNLSISFDDGSVSVGQNWETWPAGRCGGDQVCYDAQRVKFEEVLADTEAIAIAEAFVKEHGINAAMFGAPEINNTWRVSYDASPDKANYYLPEAVDVIYPLKINDQYVYDEYNGQKQGLVVSVHIKSKRVSSAYGLTTQTYESSPYDVETDAKKILAYAETGGANSYRAEGAASVTLELGDPIQGFIKYYNYANAVSLKSLNDELLVPALIFPIKDIPKDDPNFYRTAVIVPLVKEVLDERMAGLSGGIPTPLMMKGEASVVSDSVPVPASEAVKPELRKR